MQRTGSTTLSNCSRAGNGISAVQEMWDSPPVKGSGLLQKVRPLSLTQLKVLDMGEPAVKWTVSQLGGWDVGILWKALCKQSCCQVVLM